MILAGPYGFVIWRHLSAQGLHCEVVAPSSILKRSGDRVKLVLSLSKGPTGATRSCWRAWPVSDRRIQATAESA